MISAKLASLQTALALAHSSKLELNRGFLRLMQRQVADLHEQALAMERGIVPSSSRLPHVLARVSHKPVIGPAANDGARAR